MASHSTARGSHRYRVTEDSIKNNRGIGRQPELTHLTVLHPDQGSYSDWET